MDLEQSHAERRSHSTARRWRACCLRLHESLSGFQVQLYGLQGNTEVTGHTAVNSSLHTAFKRIRAALIRRGRSGEDADDFVQEAWVRLACYEREQVVDVPEAFLMRTALNLSIDAHRSSVCHGEQLMVDEVVLLDTAPGTEAIVLARERMARLSLGLGRLTDKTRDIFLSHRIDGLTYQEIAQNHGLSISTVEKHVAKATLQLTSWMEGW